MKNQICGLVASLGLAVLAGCGAGTDNAPSTQLENLLSQVNSRENVVASINITTPSRITRSADAISLQVGDGQFVMAVNNRRYTLSDPQQISQYSAIYAPTEEGLAFAVRLERANLTDALDPSTPKDYLLFGYFGSGDNVGSFGYFVTGIQTPPNTIPTTANATYSGRSYIDLIVDADAGDSEAEGRLTMQVDFAKSRISGSITNIIDPSGIANIPSGATITLEETAFNNDGSYNGNLLLNRDAMSGMGIQSTIGNLAYRGKTYGNNAASLAGVLEFRGTKPNSDNFYAVGGFYADR